MNVETENSKTEQLAKSISSHLDQFTPTISINKDEVEILSDLKNFLNLCKYLKTKKEFLFDYLRCISVVDYIDYLEINYHIFSKYIENYHLWSPIHQINKHIIWLHKRFIEI